tara:strand:+ start:1332 stop:2198 length:867 start_codon:yes stop_codon:yes gene_type:complete
MNSNENILEIGQAEFNTKVIEASSEALILVDFWAPWCGPCKQLTPTLEKVINNAKGKVKLVKINIDENQEIAAQLNIQSIPAVFAFKNGQPVNAFQGVIPEKKIIEFIEKSSGEKLEEDFTEFYNNIELLLAEKKYDEAKENLEGFLVENPNEFKSFAYYIDCLCNLSLFDDANTFIESLNSEALKNTFVKSSIQKLKIKKKNREGPSLEKLQKDVGNKPNNIESVLALADKYFAENMLDEAFELLLKNYLKNKEKIKKKCLELFEALGNDNLKTIEYRKKLSSLMFS